MSRRPADLRLLLPGAPRSVALLGSARPARAAWEACGVTHVAPEEADVVVTDRGGLGTALAARPGAVVVLGRGPVRAPGLRARRYLRAPGPAGPSLLLLADRAVRRAVATGWSQPSRRVQQARNAVLASPLGGLLADVTVLAATDPVPQAVQRAARACGRPPGDGWFLDLRRGDDLQRVVTHSLQRGTPDVVVKHSRVPGVPDRGAAEQAVLDALADRAPHLADGACRLLGRFALDGAPATVEQAVPGSTLTGALRRLPAAEADAAAARLVAWVRAVGVATQDEVGGRTALDQAASALPPGVRERLGRVPSVVVHRDLASWNVVHGPTGSTVVDWESGAPDGLPLGDLAYLLTDLLAERHGPAGLAERVPWCARLWAGRLPQSGLLRAELQAAAAEHGLTGDQAAALVVACWAHHAGSQARREAVQAGAGAGYLGLFGTAWLEDAALGAGWPGW